MAREYKVGCVEKIKEIDYARCFFDQWKEVLRKQKCPWPIFDLKKQGLYLN